MADIALHFEVEENVDPETITATLNDRLAQVQNVETTKVRPEQSRLGPLEIIAILTLATQLIRAGSSTIEELRKLLDEVRKLIVSVKGVRNAFVDVGLRRVPVSQLTEEDLKELAQQ